MADDKLAAIFNDNGPPDVEAPVQETAPAAEASAAPPAEQTGVEGAVPAQQTQGQSEDDDGNIGPVPYKRFKAVNEKLREAERRIAEANGRLSVLDRPQMQTAPGKQEAAKPSDEERFFTDGPGLLRETREGLAGQITQAKRELTYEFSEQAVRKEHADYDEKRQVFEQQLEASLRAGDQSMLIRLQQSKNPARHIYDTASVISDMKDVQSPAEYREKLRKEIRAEVEQSVRKELSMSNAASASTTNAGARGSGATTAPTSFRETADKDLFPGAMR